MSHFELPMHSVLPLTCSVAACRAGGFVAGTRGQAHVRTQMIAGVLPAPSVAGVSQP